MARRLWSRVGESPHLFAALVYVVATSVYLLFASRALLREHTPFNHFALLAESWLEHRLDLGAMPPRYTHGNDFALFQGRWHVTFPAMPAILIWPWVALSGSAERTLDGLFFLMLAGLGPAGMYLTLDRLRREQLAAFGHGLAVALTALYAFGTVYFFSAVQGTVWFAAHVVAAAGTTFYLYFALGARASLGAGIALSVAVGTRPQLLALGLFYLFEWSRVTRSGEKRRKVDRPDAGKQQRLLPLAAWRPLGWFVLPVALTLCLLAAHNYARFGNPAEFGYQYLTIAWHARIEKWGLFGYHYLARNLALLLTSLPYVEHVGDGWTLRVNGHGLALWITTPLYLWLLWPRRSSSLDRGLYTTLAAVAVPSLLYQNSGWLQFGQRFSNDYSPLLILLLAVGGYAWSRTMKALWAVALGVNLFGAITFGRHEWTRFYFIEPTQRVIFQPD